MTPRRWGTVLPVLFLGLALPAGDRVLAQLSPGGEIPGFFPGGAVGSGYAAITGYGANPSAVYTGSPGLGYNPPGRAGYSISSGRVGAGYQGAGQLYRQSYFGARPQTTIALQPLYDVITAVPGWSGRARRTRHRLQAQPSEPRASLFNTSGKIVWPSTIPDDPATDELRQRADAAVQAVVREWRSTGHGSVRPVIDAKNKLSAFEHKVLPGVKMKNASDGAALETFFLDLDKTLDAMTYTY